MKWILVLLIAYLVIELPTEKIVYAEDVQEKTENQDIIPALKIVDSKILSDKSSENVSNSNEQNDNIAKPNITTVESYNTEEDLSISNEDNVLEEDSDNSEKARVKKNGLTTICVEIKPTSPYEPPYFMCKGTQPQNNYGSGSGYKSQLYGGSDSYKLPQRGEISGSGGDGTRPGYTAPQDYGRPPSTYGTQEYSNVKPTGKYDPSGYGKPTSAGEAYSSSDGYDKADGYNSYSPPTNSGRPTRPTYDSYGPPPSNIRPSYGRPSSYNKPGYGTQNYNLYGPSDGYNRPGGGFTTPTKYGASPGGYSPPLPPSAAYDPQYTPSSHKNKPISPSGYVKPTEGGKYFPPPKFSSGSNQKGSKYSPGGYRLAEDDEEDDYDDLEMDEDIYLSNSNLGMPVNYRSDSPNLMSVPKLYNHPAKSLIQTPCSSNVMMGCQPNVIPVPCYAAPPAQAPIYLGYPAPATAPPAPSLQAAPAYVYGSTPSFISRHPMFYYPNVGVPRGNTFPADWSSSNTNKQQAGQQLKPSNTNLPSADSNSQPSRTIQGEEMSSQGNRNDMRSQGGNTSSSTAQQQDKVNDDKMRKTMTESNNKNQNQQNNPTSSYASKQFYNHPELIRKSLEGRTMSEGNDDMTVSVEKEGSSTREGPSKQSATELLQRGDDNNNDSNVDETSNNNRNNDSTNNTNDKTKINTMMKMQQLQQMPRMSQMMAAGNNGNMPSTNVGWQW